MIKPTAHQVIPFIVALSFFMEAVDTTVINTAIPAMSRSLQVDPVDLKVALISYLISLSIFIPVSGWIADKFGVKKVFISALTLFTFSSLACGLATNLTELVLARFVQGLGGALGLPVGRLILLRIFGQEHFIHTMGQVVMVGSLGLMLGPMIGGFITHYFDWHWIFLVNIPVGLFAIILVYYYLQPLDLIAVPPLDKCGFVLFGISLAGMAFGLSALSETTVSLALSLAIICCSTLGFIAYFFYSRRQKHPIIKTELLKVRTFRISALGNLLSRLGFGGIPFLLPLKLQVNLGFNAFASGLLLAPIAIGILLSKPFALTILRYAGYKQFLILNTVCSGCAIWGLSCISPSTSIPMIAFLTFIYGFVMSLQYTAMNSLAYADLITADISSANSIMCTLQQIAQSFGVAMSALLMRFFSIFFAEQIVLTPRVFDDTFLIMGVLTLCSVLIYLPLERDDGRQMLVKPT